jgi:hypothetical protein
VTKLKTENSLKNIRSRENWFRHERQEHKILNKNFKENSTKSSFFFLRKLECYYLVVEKPFMSGFLGGKFVNSSCKMVERLNFE